MCSVPALLGQIVSVRWIKFSLGCRKLNSLLSSVNLWLRVWLRAAQTERGIACRGATKKREISRTLLSLNLHFSVYPVPQHKKEL